MRDIGWYWVRAKDGLPGWWIGYFDGLEWSFAGFETKWPEIALSEIDERRITRGVEPSK
jgi:hypothetical protein